MDRYHHAQVAEAQQRAEDAARFAADLDALRVTGRSPDGAQVTLTHTGAMVDLRLPDTVPAQVAESVLAAVADAHRRIAEQVRELACAGLGAEAGRSFALAWDKALGVER